MKAYRRVLLKLSGEALASGNLCAVDLPTVKRVAQEVAAAHATGTQMALVVGGGNILRGLDAARAGLDRCSADHMGMLATIINGLALQNALQMLQLECRLHTSVPMPTIAEPFAWKKAVRHLERGRVIIFAGGTGHPFFSTDTAAALRAAETGCDVLLKATKVDGVYDSDPVINPTATLFKELTHAVVLERGLRVMDPTAVSLCMQNRLPIVVFNLTREGNVLRAVRGEPVGTLVR